MNDGTKVKLFFGLATPDRNTASNFRTERCPEGGIPLGRLPKTAACESEVV